jgi:hypothetical protein
VEIGIAAILPPLPDEGHARPIRSCGSVAKVRPSIRSISTVGALAARYRSGQRRNIRLTVPRIVSHRVL